MKMIRTALIALVMAAAGGTAVAEPTEIVVRVMSRDAKFVGSSMGGVAIILRDAQSGEVLARGVTEGGTGDTIQIMQSPGRRAVLASADAAAFRAILDIDRPRLIEAEAFGPLAQRQSAVRVTSQQWLLPGRHVREGNGWLLELAGFVVDIVDSSAPRRAQAGDSIEVRASIMMMCGCPTQPGGLWDASRYELRAQVLRDGVDIGDIALAYSGAPSQYSARIEAREAGAYDVLVTAYDAATGNTGVDRTTFSVAAR